MIRWAIAYHTNSNSPRSRKWYYLARLALDDDKFYCIGRLKSPNGFESNSLATIKRTLKARPDLATFDGVFTDSPSPRDGMEMIQVR
jgi:hypothetical protein